MKIDFLPAGNGDSIHISFFDKGEYRNILIDGGVSDTYLDKKRNGFGALKPVLDNIKNQNQKIDLLILTHIDNDHIEGLLSWFENDKEASQLIDCVWFNSGKLIAEHLKEPENKDLDLKLTQYKDSFTGVSEALDFEEYLLKKKIWVREIIKKGRESNFGNLSIKVLTPTDTQLKQLLKEYKKKTGDPIYTGGKGKDWDIDLKKFIEEEKQSDFRFKQDSSVKNGSSITLLLTFEDRKFLFLADSHPKEVLKSLKELHYSKENPLEVEFLQVSHHGSKANNCKELFEVVKTNAYVISTDSSSHGHPHKRTLSRIIKVNPNARIYFNYKHVKDDIISKQDFNDFTSMKAFFQSKFSY